MTETTLKQKTAKGLFWGGFSNGLQQLIGLGFGIYFARVLSQDDYGLVAMLAIFTGIASSIINCGFSTALINKQNVAHEDYNAVFWFTFFAGLILYVILFFCAPLIASFYEEPKLISLSRVIFISFFIAGLGIVPQTILLKTLMVKRQAIIDTIALLISCIIGLGLAIKGYAYWAIAVQSVIFISLSAILRLIVVPWKPSLNFNFSPLKQMFSFSIKLFLTNIFIQINTYIFSVILGKFFGKADLGQYDRGQRWVAMGNTFISGMINYVTQPILVQINDDKERQVGVLRKLMRFGAFISFPLVLGLAFCGEEFILITVGEKWLPSVPILQLFCIWGSVGFLMTLFTNLIFTQGKSGIYMNVTIIVGSLQIITIFCLLRLGLGIIPMLIGYITVYFIGLFIWYYYVWKLIGLRLKDVLKDILPYLGIALLCFGIVWLITRNIQNLYLLFGLKIVISGILYTFALRMSNSVMFKEAMGFLMNRVKKI
jgi:O-antigen/teichoic acid export membrane protein